MGDLYLSINKDQSDFHQSKNEFFSGFVLPVLKSLRKKPSCGGDIRSVDEKDSKRRIV